MYIRLKPITPKDGIEGFEFLKQITMENEEESPVPKEINKELYAGFLKLAYDEACLKESDNENVPCSRYWVYLDKKIIGYADIKHSLNEELKKVGGHIGLIFLKEYQNKGLGLYVMRELIDIAKTEFNIDDILITTNPDNIPMIKLCEKLGAEYTDTDVHKHFHVK